VSEIGRNIGGWVEIVELNGVEQIVMWILHYVQATLTHLSRVFKISKAALLIMHFI
jgi:hypothetical protein